MLNSIETTKYNTGFQFADVTNRKSPSDYWMKPGQIQTRPPAQFASSFKIITPEEARKTNNTRIIGLSVAGVTILTGIGLFTLMRGGGNRKLLRWLKIFKNYLEKKLENIKIDNKKIESFDKTYLWAIGVIDNLTRRSEAINNFTAFKDLLFKKIMHVTEPTGKIHDVITDVFTQIGRRSVENSYARTENKIIATQVASSKLLRRKIYDNPEQIIEINGKKATRAQWMEKITELDKDLVDGYYDNFDIKALKKRYYSVAHISQILETSFSKLKTFYSKDIYSKFIADEKIAKEKDAIIKEVKQYRKGLSYTREEMIKSSEDLLGRVSGFISFRDNTNRNLLKDIRQGLKKYIQQPNDRDKAAESVVKAVDTLTYNIMHNKVERFINGSDKEKVLSELADIKSNITGYKRGIADEILSIYKRLLPEKEFKKIQKVYARSIKSLDNSIRIETEDFTNKIRDLALGSAPTDMLTMVGSVAVLGYQLGKSDNRDQRTSIALKYGFPAIAGIAVSLYCNAKLYAGTKALIVGSLSTWVLNRIGSSSDEYIKKYKAERQKKQAKSLNVNNQFTAGG